MKTNMKINFELFLQYKHAEDYLGTDDDMPDDFERFLQDLDVNDWLELGDEFNRLKQ